MGFFDFLGLGYGITSIVVSTVVLRHFKQNKAFANGIIFLGYSVGNIIGPMIIKVLLQSYGWRGTLLLIGALSLNGAAIAITFHTPFRNIAVGTRSSCTTAIRKTLDFSLLSSKPFAIFSVCIFLNAFFFMGFSIFTPLRAVNSGISLDGAAFLSTVMYIGSLSMRIAAMFLSNMKCVDYNVSFALGALLGVPGVLFTLLMPGFNGGIVGCVLVGLSIGEYFSFYRI